MEMNNTRKNEAELKQQLATTVTELQKMSQSWASLKQNFEGTFNRQSLTATHPISLLDLQNQSDTATSELKEEKLEMKKLKTDLQRIQDELNETKSEKESAERVMIFIALI